MALGHEHFIYTSISRFSSTPIIYLSKSFILAQADELFKTSIRLLRDESMSTKHSPTLPPVSALTNIYSRLCPFASCGAICFIPFVVLQRISLHHCRKIESGLIFLLLSLSLCRWEYLHSYLARLGFGLGPREIIDIYHRLTAAGMCRRRGVHR